MATCDSAALGEEGDDNGFRAIAFNEPLFFAVALQLAKNAAQDTQTLAQLEAEAISNGFLGVAQNPQLFRAVVLQLLCNSV